MARTSRRRSSERANLALVSSGRRRKQSRSTPLATRVTLTLAALTLLVVVVKFLPVGSKNAQVQAAPRVAQAAPTDLRLSAVQISRATGGDALYLDGLATNTGNGRVRGATAEVGFLDAQGNLVASVLESLVGMTRGGTDVVPNEFARNPIKPNEMRFFRIEVKEIPPAWNHEVPTIKIVDIKAQ